MNVEKAHQLINRHFTDAAPNCDETDLVEATQVLIDEYGSATEAANNTNASAHSLSFWNRIETVPEDIRNYIYMGELAASKADKIRRLESEQAQRQVALVTIEEELIGEYVEAIVDAILEEAKEPNEAIEDIVGDTRKFRSVTLGFDEETNLQLWSEAGRRQMSKAELCQELVVERLQQLSTAEEEMDSQLTDIMDQSEQLENQIQELDDDLRAFTAILDEYVFQNER